MPKGVYPRSGIPGLTARKKKSIEYKLRKVLLLREMVEDYKNGLGFNELREIYPFNSDTMREVLVDNGVEIRLRGRNKLPLKEHINSNGYVLVKIDEDSPYYSMSVHNGRYISQHRLVMAQHLGRLLLDTETVHHKNGNRKDNNIENLQLRDTDHGEGQVRVCLDCGSHRIGFDQI